jgi:phosphoglycerate dehydrogenase-like enzyme
LFDQKHLNRLKPGTWLINASRGPVVDNSALRQVLLQREDLQAVLDVWEGEPEVDVARPNSVCWPRRTLPATAWMANSAERRRSTRRIAIFSGNRLRSA